MVEEKQKRKTKPLSISKQKAQLMAQIEAAKDAGDIEKYLLPPDADSNSSEMFP